MNKYVTNLTLPNGTNVLIKDSECRTNLSNEINRATSKETELKNAIDAEKLAREDFDHRLHQAIINETNRATSKETSLQNLIENINRAQHPIGSIYMSTESTSPASLFGGTWEQIKDKFLLSAGSTYSAGSTGGESTHTLTVNEMPSHSHQAYSVVLLRPNGDGNIQSASSNSFWNGGGMDNTTAQGGGSAHNNMPPYLTVYMWKRIA